jgi:c(7)-type cytochrome triheme protein
MAKRIAVLSLVLLLASCGRWKPVEKPAEKQKEPPVIASLKDSGLPCFGCHSYEKFSLDSKGKFSHPKHMAFGVHCNQCHIIVPHKEMTLNKDTCNNCHNLTTFTYEAGGLPVTYSHQNHEKRFSCSECHPTLFQMKKGTSNITMDEMFKGENCGRCHNGRIAFPASDCAKCHNLAGLKKDFTYPAGDMLPAVFSHQVHTAMFECSSCHPSFFKYKKGGSGMKMDDLYQGKYCGKCHDGKTAFATTECQRCHK